ncbi:hypothetical protein LEP1GSC188_2268 [Leptospira weilii serovar Topaz str. LT2116]|uniref:Uncharacterized protein n=1 Tax=Leptospira weilii serovar Topaz str. LT2116 TaxID=1088540 RepID=M3GXT0_9LEPT|nr:hypothetical protein LEP1GSC188_2268 [Leptospira weilii serovar Topaz str. LT2116]
MRERKTFQKDFDYPLVNYFFRSQKEGMIAFRDFAQIF